MKILRFGGRQILMLAVLAMVAAAGCNFTSSVFGGGEVSQEEAAQRVLDEIVQPDQLGDDAIIVFGWPEALVPGDTLHPYNILGGDPVPGLVSIGRESWFFWIEDEPLAHFSHPTRYVLVDKASGKLTLFEAEWWPVLKGQGLWIDRQSYFNQDDWVYSNVQSELEGDSRGMGPANVFAALLPSQSAQVQDDGGQKRALVLNMHSKDQSGEGDFADDAAQMFEKLTGSGFTTTYLGPAHHENANRSGIPVTEDKNDVDPWAAWLADQASKLKPGDTLFLFVTGHGVAFKSIEGYEDLEGGSIGGSDGSLSSGELSSELAKFNPGVSIITVVSCCEAGSFIEPLKDTSDLTLTATDADSPAFQDVDFLYTLISPAFTDINPLDDGSEYVSSLLQGLEDIDEDPEKVERVRQRAASEGISFWEAYFAEGHDEGSIYDLSSRLGFSNPQVAFGSAATKPKTETVVLRDDTGDGLSCDSGSPLPVETPPEIDIGTTTVERIEEDTMQYTIEFPGMDVLDKPIAGGVAFLDLSIPNSDPNPNWFFSGRSNIEMIFQGEPPDLVPEVNIFDPEAKWQTHPNIDFEVRVEGNQIIMDIPNHAIPLNGSYYISMTNFEACDEVGLGDDNLPALFLPPPAFQSDLSIPSIDELINGISVPDPLGDTAFCGTTDPLADLIADITRVSLGLDSISPANGLSVDVYLEDSQAVKQNDFSFAVTFELLRAGETLKGYVWELHDGVKSVGEVDLSSGDLAVSDALLDLQVAIFEAGEKGVAKLDIPFYELPEDGFDEIRIKSFHTPTSDSSCASDELIIKVEPVIIQTPDDGD